MSDKQSATITVEKGTKKDNGWFEISDGDKTYSTKKPELGNAALALEGKRAQIEFTVKENGQYVNRYIEAIQGIEGLQQHGGGERPIDARSSDGNPDWDMKGLHMSRNALWKAYLGGDSIPALMAWWTRANSDKGEAELLNFLRRVGTYLVTAAEYDQYNRDFAKEDDVIPF